MKITKPHDVILLLGRQSYGRQPSLTVTIGYACHVDGTRLNEQDVWKWLTPLFDKAPFDLGEKKQRGGYGVAGCACAPAGETSTAMMVRVGVGSLTKQLAVQGNRDWRRDAGAWHASAAQPFERMPLDLKHAYGGPAWPRNPHGLGHFHDAGSAQGHALPNVEIPSQPVLTPRDTPPVASLGPLAQGSPDGTRWLGKLDASWQRQRHPWLPDDTDPRWFDRFAQDQCQDSYWRGDEPWFAENMHPRFPTLNGRLPGLRPRLLLRHASAPEQRSEAPLDLDTVWLFPTDERVIVLYRAAISVQREDAEDMLGLAVFTEQLDQPAQPAADWATEWLRRDAQDAAAQKISAPAPPALTEQEAAAAAAQATATAQAAKEYEQSVLAQIAQAKQEATAEAEQIMRENGLPALGPKIEAAQARATQTETPLPHWPDDPAAFAEAVQTFIAETRAQAIAETRATLKQYGVDYDDIMARAEAKAPAQDIDPAEILAALPGPAEKRQAVLAQYQAFMKKMEALEATAAQMNAQASVPKETAPPPLDEPLPPDTGTVLDKETLLARYAAKQSCAWALLQDMDLSGIPLGGIDLSHAVLKRCVLRHTDLTGATLREADLQECDMADAILTDANFQRAMLTDCVLQNVSARQSDFTRARLTKVSLTQSMLDHSLWRETRATECDFENASLIEVQAGRGHFSASRFCGANLTKGQLGWAYFEGSTLTQACFADALLDQATLFSCDAAGARFTGAHMHRWRVMKDTNLSGAQLDRADLHSASLQNSDLTHALMRETNLDRGLIKNCDLTGTQAWHLVARAANFTGSRVAQASWRGANLMRTRWSEAILEDVDMTGVNLHAADTRRVQAQGVQLHLALMTRCRLLEDYDRD